MQSQELQFIQPPLQEIRKRYRMFLQSPLDHDQKRRELHANSETRGGRQRLHAVFLTSWARGQKMCERAPFGICSALAVSCVRAGRAEPRLKMRCFLCLEPCDAANAPCSLCNICCHPLCLGSFVTGHAACCPQCGTRFEIDSVIDGFRALQQASEEQFGPRHERTLSRTLDTAIACANLGANERARQLLEEVQHMCSSDGWLFTNCRLESIGLLAKTKPGEAIEQGQRLLAELELCEETPPTIMQQTYLVLATAHFENGDAQTSRLLYEQGLQLGRVLDIPVESRLPFFEGMAQCCERLATPADLVDAAFWRSQKCRVIECTSLDTCAIASARIEHAIARKRARLKLERPLRDKVRNSMKSLRQRRKDRWCAEIIPQASAAIYWLVDVKRRLRRKTRPEDILVS